MSNSNKLRKKIGSCLRQRGFNAAAILIKSIFLLLLSCGLTVLVLYVASYGYSEGLFESYFENPYLLFLNAWPVFLLTLLIFALTSSFRLTFAISMIFWTLLSIANAVKVYYRHEIIRVYDVELIRPALKILPHYISDAGMLTIVPAFVFFVAIFLVTRLLPCIPRHNWKVSVALVVMIVFLASVSLEPYGDWNVSAQLNEEAKLDKWVEIENNQSTGFVYAFIYQSRLAFKNIYRHYDKKLGQYTYERYETTMIPPEQRVHVFVMLLESYKDLSDAGAQLNYKRDPYLHFHMLREESLFGNYVADVFGGGTIKSELEVLSGYDGLTHSSLFHKPRLNYVQFFKDNGYFTEAMHPNDGYFYNRCNIYPNLGFDSFLYTQNYFKNDSKTVYYPDAMLFSEVLKRFNERPREKPYFNYTATMQGHGPYSYAEPEDPFFDYVEGMDKTAYATLNNYLRSIDNTGYEVWKLTREFKKSDEPIVFICFGDHSPGFNKQTYKILGLDNNEKKIDSYLNKYETPYLVWANEAAKKSLEKDFVGILPDTDPDLMLAQIFRYIGWKGSPYIQFLQEYSDVIHVYKRNAINIRGKYLKQPDGSDEVMTLIEERSAIEGHTKTIVPESTDVQKNKK